MSTLYRSYGSLSSFLEPFFRILDGVVDRQTLVKTDIAGIGMILVEHIPEAEDVSTSFGIVEWD